MCLFKVHGLMHLSFKQLQIQIAESNQGFAPLTIVYPVQERNTSSTITIFHIDECHYVSTTALQSNASISMCNELTNDTQSSRNKHLIMSIYAVCFSVIRYCKDGVIEVSKCFPFFISVLPKQVTETRKIKLRKQSPASSCSHNISISHKRPFVFL